MIIPLAPPSLAESSDLPGDCGRAVRMASPYLVLLRAGFGLPPVLPRARCALTAPFHPYPPPPLRATAGQAPEKSAPTPLRETTQRPAPPKRAKHAKAGGIFSVPLSVRLPCPGV